MDLSVSTLRQIAASTIDDEQIEILVEDILSCKKYDKQVADRHFYDLVRSSGGGSETIFKTYRELVLEKRMFCDELCLGALQKTFGLVR